jgi:hypothetical protein
MFLLLLSLLGNAEEKYTDLKEGDTAPFAGKLLTNEALAKILSQHQLELDQCKISGESKLEEKALETQFKYDLLENKFLLTSDMYEAMIENRDDVIQKTPAFKQGIKTDWAFIGGIIVGAGITIGIAYSLDSLPNQ